MYGNAVATAGDVNGDGYSDVVVGAYRCDNDQTQEGKAYVYHGTSTGLKTYRDWYDEGDQASGRYGNSVATAGDVNGDGCSDLIVGAYYYNNGSISEGFAFVYHGSTESSSYSFDWTGFEGDNFGVSIASAGDVNADGYSDVIVGANTYNSNAGKAYLFHGTSTGLETTATWTDYSTLSPASFGVSVASAGDVNGDGYSDVIIGAQEYANIYAGSGAAFVYHGTSTGLRTVESWMGGGGSSNTDFGKSVASAGDVNGDGYTDIIIGSPSFSNGQSSEGRAVVYHGSSSGLKTTVAWSVESDQASSLFGWSVSSAGDVDGDGYSDVIVGAYAYDNGQSDEGMTYVYHGSANGLLTTNDWFFEGDQIEAFLGWSVSTAGDVDNDGYSDVVVGAHYYDNGYGNEGKAFVFRGSSSGLLTTSIWGEEWRAGQVLISGAQFPLPEMWTGTVIRMCLLELGGIMPLQVMKVRHISIQEDLMAFILQVSGSTLVHWIVSFLAWLWQVLEMLMAMVIRMLLCQMMTLIWSTSIMAIEEQVWASLPGS